VIACQSVAIWRRARHCQGAFRAFRSDGACHKFLYGSALANLPCRDFLHLIAIASTEKIAAFRHGFNQDELNRQIQLMKSIGKQTELFDLALANEHYTSLLGPIEGS
jgi:hypothetical protein